VRKIAFIDLTDLKYQLADLDGAPLGGSQSAMLLVARELAAAGAEVSVIGMHLKHEAAHRGVMGLNVREVNQTEFSRIDALVSVNFMLHKATLERMFPRRRPRMIHWHKNDALAIYATEKFPQKESYAHVDRFVFCSHFQANSFISLYGVPCSAATVIANPVAPYYCGLFGADEPILAAKDPDLLVYASAPNRGLEGLLKIVYPELLKQRPGLRLEAYSGFYLDQGQEYAFKGADMTGHYQKLVATAGSMPGVTCHPGVPKAVLAQRLRKAAMLCYPTIYRETSCHVALEAMAAGCLVSSTTIGALPETTAGYAQLTPATQEAFEPMDFAKNTLLALEEREREPAQVERRLRRQVEHINRCHAPAVIGGLWRDFLATEIRRGGGKG
jgi:glycosyltransferase involved in cell wall biosynthesis